MRIRSTIYENGDKVLKKKKPVSAGFFCVLMKMTLRGIFTKRLFNNLIVAEFPNNNQQTSSLNKSIYTRMNHG